MINTRKYIFVAEESSKTTWDTAPVDDIKARNKVPWTRIQDPHDPIQNVGNMGRGTPKEGTNIMFRNPV